MTEIPQELAGPEWETLAKRLGYTDVGHMLRWEGLTMRPEARGWRAEWIRLYDGVRSDRRFRDRLPSLAAVLAAMNESEDLGDREDAEAARGEE